MAKRKRTRNVSSKPRQTNSYSYRKNNALVDVIIPVYRRFDLLNKCLNAIPEAMGELSYQVIIFDNGSPKEEADVFYSSLVDPNIRVIRGKENYGFIVACNTAFDVGTSPLVFFLNDDVILHPGSVLKLVQALDDPKIGVVGMKLIFPEETDLRSDASVRPAGKIQHIGLESDIQANFVHQYLGWNPDHPKVNAVREVYAVTGAALMTRRNLFIKAGKFFTGYGRGTWEDVDYCLTVRSMGYNVIVVPEAVGIHYTGATAETYNLGYDLSGNKAIFLSRWKDHLDWTEWRSH